MSLFDKLTAQNIVSEFGLEESNRTLANYWLSLWEGDTPPSRSKLSLNQIKLFLSGILMFEVVPNERVTVKLAGTGYRYVLDEDPTNKDWVAAAPESHRGQRLKIFSSVARGAILVAHRRIAMLSGEDFISEEIALPFVPDAVEVVPILVRVNFASDQFIKVKSIPQITGDPLDYRLMPFSAS